MEQEPKSKWWTWILNKFVIVGILFMVWMIFFDQNSYRLHRDLDREIVDLKDDRQYFQSEINKQEAELERLNTDQKSYEKLAREKYFMKRENEDIFVIEIIDTTQKNE
ncbi:MAG: septum formation initiator family protein [Weeksellaceae bacterium]|nr:septum formation initiator family protein [Weeksellaceae bacterium]